MKSEPDLNFTSNFRVISDDVTLVEPLSNEFTNRLFMISISIFIDAYYDSKFVSCVWSIFHSDQVQ